MDETIERMCTAHWNVAAITKWADIPEAWKPFYRDAMRAALKAEVEHAR